MSMDQMRESDLVLPPNTYAFVLDNTKGRVSVYTGPFKSSLSQTDQLVTWDAVQHEFVGASRDRAVQTFVTADEGQYIVLSNPTQGEDAERHPASATSTEKPDLNEGRKINIHGPTSFPLWPGQTAEVIDGHHLKSNQYLLVRVYQPEQAQQHAEAAMVAPQADGEGESKGTTKKTTQAPRRVLGDGLITMGKLIVIRGTGDNGVSFYMPSTGIEVLPDDEANYVRDATTLERLEHCILLNENGNKRFVQGPAVVFPEPTEHFVLTADKESKARAIELNAHSGLYIKVIADYENAEDATLDVMRGGQMTDVEKGGLVREGDELFITGKRTPIYFPRPEQMLLTYRQQRRHHAIAIPRGEGRYVLDRPSGNVRLVKGPKMFLADPRVENIVQRILPADQIAVMYPGNQEAMLVNAQLANRQADVANVIAGQRMTPDAGMMSTTPPPPGQVEGAQYTSMASASLAPEATFASYASAGESTSAEEIVRSSKRSRGRRGALGESERQATTQSKPRTITLDTKYQGAVAVSPYSGYAIMVTNRTGDRRVELGPKVVLLDYDETPVTVSLSTGRPKSDNRLKRDVYLRIINNVVTDQVTVETSDFVEMEIDLSYRVNFEGDPNNWFNVENYVQLICDHGRSRLRNIAKRHTAAQFYERHIDIIRDHLLGETEEKKGRSGLAFSENGMRMTDLEVLGCEIMDSNVEDLLEGAARNSMTGAIELAQAREISERTTEVEKLNRTTLIEREKTRDAEAKAVMAALERELRKQLANEHRLSEIQEMQIDRDANDAAAHREVTKLAEQQRLQLTQSASHIELEALASETDQFIRRMDATKGGIIEALQAFGDKVFVSQLMEGLGSVGLAAGMNTSDILSQVFKGTPLESAAEALSSRPFAQRANGHAVVSSGGQQ